MNKWTIGLLAVLAVGAIIAAAMMADRELLDQIGAFANRIMQMFAEIA